MSEAAAANARNWQPWRMDELAEPVRAGDDRSGPAGTDPRASAALQSELQALRDQVREQAERDGYAAGRAQGHEEGYQQGLDAGRKAGTEELAARRQQLVEPLAALIGGLRTALEQLDTDIGDALADLALAAGRQLAGEALAAKPAHIKTVIRTLLREEPLFSGHPQLRLHPDDLPLVDAQLADELKTAGWKTLADPTLERGGCCVTGADGELNATREARWQALVARARRHGSAPLHNAGRSKPAGRSQ